jgi:tetratricopeptide (TPR) repeat protein
VTILAAVLLGFLSPAGAGEPYPSPYSGSRKCRKCHEAFYGLWATSHHGLAMQPWTADLGKAITPMAGEIAIEGARYRADLEGGRARVIERGASGEKSYPVVHAMGGKNVYYFLTPLDRGRLQVLPLAYDVRKKTWFDVARSGVRHFPDRADAALHWTDRQYTFNTACFGCHVSQASTGYDPAADSYRTVWIEPGINCESCHGPGEEHVREAEKLPAGATRMERLGLVRTGALSPRQMNDLCATCHAKAAPLTTAFRPGDDFFDHYDLATLEDPDFYPDGRDLGENYTMTSWLQSPCARSGKLDCNRCHTPSGRYRFEGGRSNEACLPCHEGKVTDAAGHSRHKADGPGSRCIACHMPHTEFAAMGRSDHSMRPPTPAATIRYGSPNACNLCHADRDAAWADRIVRERPRDHQAGVLRLADLLDGARKGDWRSLDAMVAIVRDPGSDLVYRNSLVRLLRRCDDPKVRPALLAAIRDPSPLVRGSAAEALSATLDPAALAALSGAARDPVRLVRIRAGAALSAVPPDRTAEGDRPAIEKAVTEYLEVLGARPDDWSSHYNRGNFHLGRQEIDRAVAAYETAVRLEARAVLPLVNLSIAYSSLGRLDRAEESLRAALRVQPGEPTALFNLGLLLAEKGDRGAAEEALRGALKADPGLAQAAFNLGILTFEERPDEAIAFCREACRLRPRDPRYAYTLAYFLDRSGAAGEALAVLEGLAAWRPEDVDAALLLGAIHEREGRPEAARGAYERALGPGLTTHEDRLRLEARLEALKSR